MRYEEKQKGMLMNSVSEGVLLMRLQPAMEQAAGNTSELVFLQFLEGGLCCLDRLKVLALTLIDQREDDKALVALADLGHKLLIRAPPRHLMLLLVDQGGNWLPARRDLVDVRQGHLAIHGESKCPWDRRR